MTALDKGSYRDGSRSIQHLSSVPTDDEPLSLDSRPTPVVPLSAFLAQDSATRPTNDGAFGTRSHSKPPTDRPTVPAPASGDLRGETPSIPIPEPIDDQLDGAASLSPSEMPPDGESIPPPVRSPYAHALFVVVFAGILVLLGYELSIKYHIPLPHLRSWLAKWGLFH